MVPLFSLLGFSCRKTSLILSDHCQVLDNGGSFKAVAAAAAAAVVTKERIREQNPSHPKNE